MENLKIKIVRGAERFALPLLCICGFLLMGYMEKQALDSKEAAIMAAQAAKAAAQAATKPKDTYIFQCK
jgi:hypothetical protein